MKSYVCRSLIKKTIFGRFSFKKNEKEEIENLASTCIANESEFKKKRHTLTFPLCIILID